MSCGAAVLLGSQRQRSISTLDCAGLRRIHIPRACLLGDDQGGHVGAQGGRQRPEAARCSIVWSRRRRGVTWAGRTQTQAAESCWGRVDVNEKRGLQQQQQDKGRSAKLHVATRVAGDVGEYSTGEWRASEDA